MTIHLLLMLIIVLPISAAIMGAIAYAGKWIGSIVGPLTSSVVDGPFVSIFFGLIVGATLSRLMILGACRVSPPGEKRLLHFWRIRNQLILWSIAGFLASFVNPWIIGVVVGVIVVTYIPVDFELG